MVNRDLIDGVRAGLAARANAARAAGMRAYMKSEMPYRGVQTAGVGDVAREVFSALPLVSFADWRETSLALWDEARFREERYAALALVGWRGYREFLTSLEALPLFEQLLYACIEPSLASGVSSFAKRLAGRCVSSPKPRPDEVQMYVAAHETQLSGLSRREALKDIRLHSDPASA